MGKLLRRAGVGARAWWCDFTAPAEDPRKAFPDAYGRQLELLAGVCRTLENLASSGSELEAKAAYVREKLPQLEDYARQALLGGREDLARLALARRQVADAELRALERQVGEIGEEERRLSLVHHRLAAHLEAHLAREGLLEARYTAAEAQVRITEALAGLSEELSGLGLDLHRAEEQAEEMEARAAAIDRLVDAGAIELVGLRAGDAVESERAGIDGDRVVDERLAALKRELAAGRRP